MAGAGFPPQGTGGPPQKPRTCVFVDSTNFRNLFAQIVSSFDPAGDPWPSEYYWTTLWQMLADSAWQYSPAHLVRCYWYIPEGFELQGHWDLAEDRRDDLRDKAGKLWVKARNHIREIERSCPYIEFRPVGHRFFKASDETWGKEKGLDVAMAVEMVTLAPIYEIAVVVSGDADFIPAIKAVKNQGRMVAVPRFLDLAGGEIAGQARSLLSAADYTYDVKAQHVRKVLGVAEGN